jgi:hypothetical protein
MAAVRLGTQGAAAVAPDVTTPTVKKGFEWMPTYAAQAVGLRSATARTAAALNAGDVKRGVLHGVLPDVEIAAVEDPNLVRFTLPAAQAATVATQLRNTNAALFSPMAFDLVARLAQLSERPLSEVVKGAPGIDARIKALPHAPHGEMPTANIPDDMAIDDPFDLQRRSFERRSRIADSGRTAEDSEMPGPAYYRAPVGDYGDDLARALVDAARVLLREATEVCATASSSSAYAEINPKLAIADDLAGTWAQGIEGMCSAVAALTAKRVPGKSVDDVLASLGDGSALSQFAARAPVYVLEPLVGSGHVSKRGGCDPDQTTILTSARWASA